MIQDAIKQAITPLRMIFWGGLLCVIDICISTTTNGVGFKFDILSDVLGAILIAVGVYRLSILPVHPSYKSIMKFVQIVSVLFVLDAVRDMFIMPLPQWVGIILALFGLVSLAAEVSFCVAMCWFCEQAELLDAARSWSVTKVLFVVIYLIPLGLFYCLSALAIISGKSINLDLGPAIFLVLPLFAVPIIHLFVSTSRMKSAAEAA